MLLQMRQFTRSWVAYVLIFILAALFVVFLGNGQSIFSALGTQASNVLASGKGVEVRPEEVSRELDLALRQERNQGQVVTRQDAIKEGRHLQVLDSIAGRKAIFSYAERLGVSASNRQVADRIREIPMAKNPVTDAFDQTMYNRFLSETGYSQPEFEAEIRGELSANMLLEALVAGARAPSSYGALGLIYQGESRTVSIAETEPNAAGTIAPPTAAQLQTFYQENQAQLQVPEFRVLSLVYARPQDFMARVTVPEEQLNQEVEARVGRAGQPERRTYVRIIAQTQEQANAAAARLARGEAPDAIAASLGEGVQAQRSENQARADVPDSRVGEAVFAMAAGAAPRVVQGQLSPWVVVRVDAVTPAVAANVAEIRETVRTAIAHEEASDMVNAAVQAFEEARDGGASLADAARSSGLTLVTLPPVNQRGGDERGQPVAAVAGKQELLQTAFQAPEGEASDFLPIDDADVIVNVDRIIAPRVRSLDEVRDQLSQLWVAQERQKRLREYAQAVADAVRGGQTLAAAARAHHMRVVVPSRPVTRQNANQIPAQGLAGQIFAGREGAVVTDMNRSGQSSLVAVIEHINRPDPATAPQETEAARVSLQQSMVASFANAVQSQIVDNANIRRNEGRVAQIFGSGEQGDEGEQ